MRRRDFARIYGIVQAQAAAIAYSDVYWLVALSSAVMVVLALMMKKNSLRVGGEIAVH